MNSGRVAPAVRTAETADLTVVGGAGHIGIPLVLAFAEAGLTVNVNDLNRTALDALAGGKLPFIEYGAEALLAKALADERLIFTDSPGKISRKSPVVVTIGTPVDEFLNPLQKVVQECVDGLLPHMIDHVENQTLVHQHGGVAKPELISGEGGKLHCVLEQAGAGRIAGSGHVFRARIIVPHRAQDVLIVDAGRLGDHVELVGGGKLDIAIGVVEQLGEFRLDRRHANEFRRDQPEQRTGLLLRFRRDTADDLRHLP